MNEPSALSQALGFIAFWAAVALVARIATRFLLNRKTTARAGQDQTPPARAATNDLCHGCELVAPVQMYRTRRYCRTCAEAVAAIDQAIFNQRHADDFRRWEAGA